jgi:hypothetical protein
LLTLAPPVATEVPLLLASVSLPAATAEPEVVVLDTVLRVLLEEVLEPLTVACRIRGGGRGRGEAGCAGAQSPARSMRHRLPAPTSKAEPDRQQVPTGAQGGCFIAYQGPLRVWGGSLSQPAAGYKMDLKAMLCYGCTLALTPDAITPLL